jgi:hypothetical protein
MSIEVFKEVIFCVRDIIARTPKPGPTIDQVMNDLASELGVTQQTISDWMAGKGIVEPWQLEILRKKAQIP